MAYVVPFGGGCVANISDPRTTTYQFEAQHSQSKPWTVGSGDYLRSLIRREFVLRLDSTILNPTHFYLYIRSSRGYSSVRVAFHSGTVETSYSARD